MPLTDAAATVYDFSATSIDGREIRFDGFHGSVLLIVNVASRCGYTPQYRGLGALYRKYRHHGLVVVGFPCDQFGHQEPGTDDEIKAFCSLTFDVTFPMFAKVNVNGELAHPLFRFLKSRRKGWLGSEAIKWNFTKFLVGRTGDVVKRYGPADTPDAIEADVLKALAASNPAVTVRQ